MLEETMISVLRIVIWVTPMVFLAAFAWWLKNGFRKDAEDLEATRVEVEVAAARVKSASEPTVTVSETRH